MKCKEHSNEANDVCSNCGVGLCETCTTISDTGKSCCSNTCVESTKINEAVIDLTLERATKGALSSAYGSYILGSIFLIFAIFGAYKNSWFLLFFLGAAGLGLIGMGVMYHKSTQSKSINK